MPDIAFFMNLFSVILQYGLIFFIYYFIYLLLKLIYHDLHPALEKKQPESTTANLFVLDSNSSLRQNKFAIDAELSIGRGKENDIVIDDTYISHHHAIINRINNLYVIEDLNSVNHTYLNGKLLAKKTYLQSGDIIKIGLVTFKFER
ncbi:FHA domain-containing protein [Propionispira arboris]|uniref:FHA domain-containing protein n=2 Tax=Propionispira arboris TaxID=84035 RepID=A0A1H6W314_9FIRM|nr:FHA domain-containing protein [Propionispira arboris]